MKPIAYDELVAELGMVSTKLHALATRVTRLRDRSKPMAEPLPKTWDQMHGELISIRERVVETMYYEEFWSYRPCLSG